MNLLEAKNISLYFGRYLVVKNFNLNLMPGEIVGLIGPNGAGKSTVMKGLARVLPIRSGEVVLKGRALKKIKMAEFSRTVAYLPQSSLIYWPLQVRNAVALGRIPHLGPWDVLGQKDEDAVHRAMADTGILHLKKRTVTRLAGGERALVLLARALAVEPELLIADEPVTGLDPNHQIQVMSLLEDMARIKGCGILVVLHDLTLAARFCHRLFLLRDGRTLAEGVPEEVLSPKNLKAGYGIKAKYGRDESGFFVLPWERL